MNLISAPRPFSQRARRAARLGLDIPRGYFAFIVGMPFYHASSRRIRVFTGLYRALHLRRCLARRARDRGWQRIRPYLWYDQVSDVAYYQSVTALEPIANVVYRPR